MFRYIMLSFLLISTSCKSLGKPTNGTIKIGSLLTALTNRCGNPFLSNQIKSKLEECNSNVPPIAQKEFLCLIFYDINRELCAAVNSTGLKLNEDSLKINEEQDVNKVCDVAKNWNVTNKTEYVPIKDTMDRVFKEPLMCIKVCGTSVLASIDTNFYCKYYRWGWEMLNSQTNTLPAANKVANKAVAQAVPVNTDANSDKKSDTSPHSVNPTDIKVDNVMQQKLNELEFNQTTLVKTEKVEETKKDEVSNTQTAAQESSLNTQVSNLNNISNLEKSSEVSLQSEPSGGILPENNDDEKPILAKDEIAKNDEIDKYNQLDKRVDEQKESVIENPKTKTQNGDTEDYQESDEGKEGLPDIQGGDDSDDPMLNDLDTKIDPDQNKNANKKIETPVSNFGEAQKEYYPIQEGFTDDDDHFFPFFLTAVILVVLMYILYHNKNKVSKVFFGLLVEGRQPGRRRNSRGHAYKRLDTLEQAMSTNTAAPPSKIIY